MFKHNVIDNIILEVIEWRWFNTKTG